MRDLETLVISERVEGSGPVCPGGEKMRREDLKRIRWKIT